ncbi:MAG: hypothetical protein EYC67_17810 [Betaproteobacteria bacterium]|nr:MAG: hypothetical protein EYC67_17810 [Betaproteobacteria bacterium]
MRPLRASICACLLAACTTLPPYTVPAPGYLRQGLVVVDIDGTLTPRDSAFLEAREGAAQALAAYVRKGYAVVYLSARVPLLQQGLPDWLRRHGFPDGPLHVAQSADNRARVDRFKADVLRVYALRGWRLAFAYGDSSTDFQAYAEAGFRPDQVYAIRRRGDPDCQPGSYVLCLDGWTGPLPGLERELAPTR